MDICRAIFTCSPLVGLNTFSSAIQCEDEKTARKIMEVLERAEKPGRDVQNQVIDLVDTANWTESLAQALLDQVIATIQDGKILAGALKDAMSKATEAATDFAKEHPVYTTIIAFGILAVLLPWVIEALGFSELGPVAGSFAARWQSLYNGYVRSGSLFSYFQRLGMTWRRVGMQFMKYPAPN